MPELPAQEATKLILEGRAPTQLVTGILDFSKAATTIHLPVGLHCYSLKLNEQPIAELPTGLKVDYKLDLTNCRKLRVLPPNFKVSTLILTNCTGLTALPENLEVNFLQLDGCTALRDWPENINVSCGWVRARGCTALKRLPAGLGPIASLDLRGCRQIESIPESAQISSSIDIGGTRISSLPESLNKVALRWRGVQITPQIAFFPETLNSTDILNERNTELRRVMIERVGFEKFLREVNAEVFHSDRDKGGERKLYRVELQNDEPIVVVSLLCPSTGRHYLVRVPPTMKTCHQAVAWTAGFDNPDDYAPIEET